MKLAINGGKQVLCEPFPVSNNIGLEETNELVEVMKTGVLSDYVAHKGQFFLGGKRVKDFERAFKEKYGVKYAVSVNSASTGLECALAAVGVTYGDEVIVPPYTMAATATSVLLRGGVPVFADINPETFTIDPKSITAKITPYTKAIIAVNLFGQAADLDEIMEVAIKHNLKVIEDNAQSPGGLYKGRYTGTIADIGVFSLNFHKVIHSGEGGVCVTSDDELGFRLQLARNHGDVVIDDYSEDEKERYNYILGSNYRLTELQAAIAMEQLKKLDLLNDRRIELAEYLSEKIEAFNGLIPPVKKKDVKHVYYVYPIKFHSEKIGLSRSVFIKALRAEGLTVNEGYVKPIYLTPLYQKRKGEYAYIKMPFELMEYRGKVVYERGICPVCEKLYENELFALTDCRYPLEKHHMDIIVDIIKKVLDNRDELPMFGGKAL